MTVTSISQRPGPGVDPNIYAQQYATKNGITLEAAKAELKAKFGDPPSPPSIFEAKQKPDASIDPNTYLSQSGSTKADLQAQFGDPQEPSLKQNSSILNLLKQLILLLAGNDSATKTAAPEQGTTGSEGEKYLDGLVAKELGVNPKPGLAKDNEVKSEADVSKLNKTTTAAKTDKAVTYKDNDYINNNGTGFDKWREYSDSNGKKVKAEKIGADNKIMETVSYDSKGNITSDVKSNPANALTYKDNDYINNNGNGFDKWREYSDSNGKKIKAEKIGADNKIMETVSYDSKGI